MKADTTTEATRKTVLNFYQALSDQNLEAVASHFADELYWSIPGEQSLAPWLGERKNRQEVKEFFQSLWKSIEPVGAKIDHILAEGNTALVSGNFASRMLHTGKVFESVFFTQFTVENNVIVRYLLLEDTNGLVKALTY
jgi:hypothetical protein